MSPIAYCTVWFVIGILTYPHIAPFHAAVPFVVLCKSSKVHLDHLIQQLQPKEVIADGSNYKSYIKRWEEGCKSYGIKLHDTSMEGAFTLNP